MERLADESFALLGINSDADREGLKEVLESEPITWRSWWDEGSVEGPIHTRWQITLRPAIHVLDVDGVIRFKDLAGDDLDAAIDALLEEAADAGDMARN